MKESIERNSTGTVPGMIFRVAFDKPNGQGYKGFINYIGRDNAVNPFAFDDFVLQYMDNSVKTFGIFTNHMDSVKKSERKNLKRMFSRAQRQGSLLWKPVISFDNDWLIDNGLMDPETKEVDEEELRRCTRKAVSALLKKEGLPNGFWAGAIHKNTDHIHIHLAIVDPNPSWVAGRGRCFENENGELEQKGKFRQESIKAFKRSFVNSVIRSKEFNARISELTRSTIYSPDFAAHIHDGFFLRRKFLKLADKLPNDRRMLKYGLNAMGPYRSEIDDLTDEILEKYYPEEFSELKSMWKKMDEKYRRAYGDKNNNYYDEKMKDLHHRCGNQILGAVSEYKKEVASKQHKVFGKNHGTGYSWNNYRLSRAGDAIYQLKRALRDDIESLKNERAYEKLQRDIDYDMEHE